MATTAPASVSALEDILLREEATAGCTSGGKGRIQCVPAASSHPLSGRREWIASQVLVTVHDDSEVWSPLFFKAYSTLCSHGAQYEDSL